MMAGTEKGLAMGLPAAAENTFIMQNNAAGGGDWQAGVVDPGHVCPGGGPTGPGGGGGICCSLRFKGTKVVGKEASWVACLCMTLKVAS